jgi:phenylalanyl-tRNA synthetase alpha chain
MSLSPEELHKQFVEKLSSINSIEDLEHLRVAFLGRKGFLTNMAQGIATLPLEDRKAYGAGINRIKSEVESALAEKKLLLEKIGIEQTMAREKIDITLAARDYKTGGDHPLEQAIKEIEFIFAQMGFTRCSGPEIEDDWHNFTALNIPESHPARQMHDTFYLEGADAKLLRTHTSSVQIRHMKANHPPARIISIGRVYRADDDATHTPMFHQIEGLCIDKNITMANMKHCIENFLQQYFQINPLPIRLRPSFFPFTEPSVEVDVRCDRSSKEMIKIGEGDGWLEILGCGMVHPNVLQNLNIDPEEYQGFAFGIGIERLVMLKYNIPDLRTLFSGNIYC